ncbi:hypothetical protein QQG74_26735 [Micromonospora sp. FIMYZ51]|uniref:hypothetical protein n=1 Tax=Micromonospora sp. FIMYZ51 TaxID=3051832 RepID=UPI00311F1857
MAENYTDPSGNTEAFRAFANTGDAPAQTASRTPLIIGAVVIAALLIAAAGWLALG